MPVSVDPARQLADNLALEREQVYEGIRSAHAAGNAQAVGRLGAYLDELDAREAASAPATPEAPEAPPPGFFGGPKVPLRFDQMERDVRGVVAGGVGRTVAGLGQLANTAYNMLAGTNALPQTGISGEAYNAAADDFLKSIRGRDYPDDAPARDWLPERAAELGVGMVFGVPSKAAKFWGSVRTAALNSGIGAAVTYDKTTTAAEKSGSIALGMLAGAGLTSLVFGGGKLWNSAVPWFVKHQNRDPDVAQQEAVRELVEKFPELKDQLTIAQQSGSRAGADVEAKAAGQYALAQYREQAEILRRNLAEFGDKYGPSWDPASQMDIIAERGMAAARAETQALARVKNAEWDSAIASAEAAITARRIAGPGVHGSEQVPFDASGIEDTLTRLVSEFDLDAQKLSLSPAIQKMRDEIRAFNGHLSLETLLGVLKKTNSTNFNPIVGAATDNQQHAFASAFRKAVFDAVDNAPDGTSDAITWIKAARRGYAHRSAQIETFRKSAVAGALGLDSPNADPTRALAAITSASRGQQDLMRRVLGEHDPQMLNEMRGIVWRNAMEGATSHSQDATKSVFDPVAHAETVLKLVGTTDDQLGGLFSKTDADAIRGMMVPIRAIMFSGQFAKRAAELEGTGMSLGGAITTRAAAAPFVARSLSRFFWSPLLDKALFTPAGRKALLGVYTSLGTPKLDRAIGRLAATVNTPQEPEE